MLRERARGSQKKKAQRYGCGRRGGGTFTELTRERRVSSDVTRGELYFYLHYYFATLCAPAVILALFVCYLFFKNRNRRL
jgi:hypothetical protein